MRVTYEMEAYLEQVTVQQLQKIPTITHQQLMDPLFMTKQRTLAMESLRQLPLAEKQRVDELHKRYLNRIKTELLVISKTLPLTIDLKVRLIKYIKEIRLYTSIFNTADISNSKEETEEETLDFQAWVLNLNDRELAIIADLISDL
jgi:hypothetical protein